MPSPESLRLRVKLSAQFDQLTSRLDDEEPAAIAEAQDRLAGLTLCRDPYTLGLVFRSLGRVLDEMQDEIDYESNGSLET